MNNHKLIFIDIETTGLDFTQNEIIEIGAVLVSDGEIIKEFECKVNPISIQNSNPISLKINHYNKEDWQDAVSLPEALEKLLEISNDAIMVAHNVAFDSQFLDYAFLNTGLKNNMHYHKLDTISIAYAKLHGMGDMQKYSLRSLCEQFQIENKNAHSALSDARATYELYKKLMLM